MRKTPSRAGVHDAGKCARPCRQLRGIATAVPTVEPVFQSSAVARRIRLLITGPQRLKLSVQSPERSRRQVKNRENRQCFDEISGRLAKIVTFDLQNCWTLFGRVTNNGEVGDRECRESRL